MSLTLHNGLLPESPPTAYEYSSLPQVPAQPYCHLVAQIQSSLIWTTYIYVSITTTTATTTTTTTTTTTIAGANHYYSLSVQLTGNVTDNSNKLVQAVLLL